MTLGVGFRRLTRVLRRLEEADWEVQAVRPVCGDGFTTADPLEATIRCVHATGALPAAPTRHALDLADHPVEIRPNTVRGASGEVEAVLRVKIWEASSSSQPTVESSQVEPPLHRDGPRLRSLYRRHDTFAEIAEAIPENVSAETVRRYMIEHDVHEPGSKKSAGTAVRDVPAMMADGMGTENDLPLETIVTAVAESNTVYDVQRRLGMDRDRTASLLRDLGLVDLVLGRLGDAATIDQRKREIRQRLGGDARERSRN